MDDSHLNYGLGNNLRYVAASLPDFPPLARCIEYQKPAASTSGAFQPRSTTGGLLRSPIRRHALAPIEAAILLSGPSFSIAPHLKVRLGPVCEEHPACGFKIGAGTVEGLRHAGGAFAGATARIESAMPLPRLGIVRIADTRHDRAGVHVAKVNLPAFLAMLWRRRVRAGMPHDRAECAGSEAAGYRAFAPRAALGRGAAPAARAHGHA
jgi:hypothetical protein